MEFDSSQPRITWSIPTTAGEKLREVLGSKSPRVPGCNSRCSSWDFCDSFPALCRQHFNQQTRAQDADITASRKGHGQPPYTGREAASSRRRRYRRASMPILQKEKGEMLAAAAMQPVRKATYRVRVRRKAPTTGNADWSDRSTQSAGSHLGANISWTRHSAQTAAWAAATTIRQ